MHLASCLSARLGVAKCPFTVRALSAVRAPDTSARLIRSPNTQRASEDLQRIQSLGAASLSYSNLLARDVQSIAYEARAAGKDPGGCGGGDALARHRPQEEVSRGRAAFGGDPHRMSIATSSAAGIRPFLGRQS